MLQTIWEMPDVLHQDRKGLDVPHPVLSLSWWLQVWPTGTHC